MRPSCTRDTDGIAAKLLRCGIASEVLRRNVPRGFQNLKKPLKHPDSQVNVFFKHLELDIFENPYEAPRPTESQNPLATKKETPQTPKTPVRSPKVNVRSPKVNAKYSPKVNVKYFEGICEDFKVLKFPVGWSRSQGSRNIQILRHFHGSGAIKHVKNNFDLKTAITSFKGLFWSRKAYSNPAFCACAFCHLQQ